jgi:antitoxin component YwqK of YwqJK toxin-antitoxin module
VVKKSMKVKLFSLVTALLMLGCGSPDVDDPETLDEIIAEAIDEDNLQYRGKEGEELSYAPNEQTPYTGWIKKIHSNGQVRMLLQIKDGKPSGLQTVWFENGQKKDEGNWKDGKTDGLKTTWFENGQKKEEGNWKDGKLDGLVTMWYENGQKLFKGNWKDGKLDGLVTMWHENGQKQEEKNYPDGLLTAWYENGQKGLEENSKDGKQISAEVWKPNGVKCPETNLKDGTGVVVYYNEGGTERSRETFKDGKLVEVED